MDRVNPLKPVEGRLPPVAAAPSYGVYAARVTDVQDPENTGRVRVTVPQVQDSSGAAVQGWARLATMMAGADRGSWFVPDVEDEVVVAFEAGDVRRPYVLGAVWNRKAAPPAPMDSGNTVKMLRTRTGLTMTLRDQEGQEQIALATPGGQTITLSDGPGGITVKDSNGNAMTLQTSGISITASASVSVQASRVAIASADVRIDAGLVKCSGVLQADTVITNSVVSAHYTPGAGNVQ